MKYTLTAILLMSTCVELQAYSRVDILKQIVQSKQMNLRKKKCVPCEGNVPPLTEEQAQELLPLIPAWSLTEDKVCKLVRNYIFVDFEHAMTFVNKVAIIAEHQGHHPAIKIQYNKVTLELFTFAIRGLSENDFIVASNIDGLDDHAQTSS